MNASSSVLGFGVLIAIMMIAAFGTRNTWRPIRGRTAEVLTRVLLAVGAVTLTASIAVWAVILNAQ
jgi:hypothetical protein